MNKQPPSPFLYGLCRLTGFLFLTLIPLVTLVPVTPVPAWMTEDLILRWISALAFLLCFFCFLKKRKSSPGWDWSQADWILILFSIWALLSANNSQQRFDSFYALKNLGVMVFFWFSLRMLWEWFPELYEGFLKVYWLTSVLAAAWILISTIGRWPWLFPRVFDQIIPRQGFFTNPNIAAGFLGMALIFALLRMLRQERVNWIGFLIVLVAWGLTQSRGAFLSMIMVVVIYALINTKEIEKKLSGWNINQWKKFGVVVLLAVCAAVPMVNRLFHALEMDPRAYFRIEVWESAFHMVEAKPLWGFGPGTFGDVYPIYRSGFLWNTITDFAHNEYLQVAAECGIPALLLTLLLMGSLWNRFYNAFRPYTAFMTLPRQVQAAEVAFYMILFESLQNFVDFTFQDWSHRLVLLGFVTCAMTQKAKHEDIKISLRFSPRAQFLVACVLAVVVIWFGGVAALNDYQGQMYNFKSTLELRSGDLNSAESDAQKSIALKPDNMYPWNTLGTIEDAKAGLTPSPMERAKLFALAKADFGQAVSLSPYSMGIQENEIVDLVKQERFEDAIDMEKQLIAKAPEDPTHYLGLSMILMKIHRPQEALPPILQALNIDNDFVPACLLKAEILQEMGKKREALKAYQQAQSIMEYLHLKDPSGQLVDHIRQLQSELQ